MGWFYILTNRFFLVFAVSIELIPQKSPTETCEVLIWDDVASPPNLQRMQIQAGDLVVEEGKLPETWRLVRSRPLWVGDAKDFRDGFGKGFEDMFAPPASLWLLAALINYVMVGSLRILPWRKIRQAR